MTCDRFIFWKSSQPSKEEIESVLTNFFGGVAEIRWGHDRFWITLPGKNTFPFDEGFQHPHAEAWREKYAEPYHVRMIEVWPSPEALDVMTRMADEYTNTLANGLAELFARYWNGTLEK